MALVIRPIEQFDVNSVVFSNINKNEKGGKAVYLNLPGKQKLLFQLPSMRAPFGLSNFVDKATGKATFAVVQALAVHALLLGALSLLPDPPRREDRIEFSVRPPPPRPSRPPGSSPRRRCTPACNRRSTGPSAPA